MSADATTLLTALLSAKPSRPRASPNPVLQQALVARMGALLQQAQGQLQQGKGLNMKVDVDVLREFVKNASLLTNHLMAIQQSNIECKQVQELFEDQANANQLCNILVTSDKQRKCKVVRDKCTPVAEAAETQVGEVQELLAALSAVKRTEAKAYAQLVYAVLQDLESKATNACNGRCAMMVSQFGRTVRNAFSLFEQHTMKPADQLAERITSEIAGKTVRNLDSTISTLKNAVKHYKTASEAAYKKLEAQQRIFNAEYAKLGIA